MKNESYILIRNNYSEKDGDKAMNNAIINVPAPATKTINLLETAGFSAYLVGGCVRDSLLDKEPLDWDIATSATPSEVTDILQQYSIIPTGLKHGTVTAIVDDMPIEVTTFRTEGAYSDGRRPDSVTFVSNLTEDLARRDFAINAMAWNPRVGIVDPFGGQRDLRWRIIRCVGDPEERFREDPLRILRGMRFASTLGFNFFVTTADAMLRLRHLLDGVARERVAAELNKALLGDGFKQVSIWMPQILTQVIPELTALVGFKQNNPAHCFDAYTHTIHAVSAAPGIIPVKLALLLHDVEKPGCYSEDCDRIGHFYGHASKSAETAKQILHRIRYDNDTIELVCNLIKHHDATLVPTTAAAKRWLRRYGADYTRNLLAVMKADDEAKAAEFQEKNLNSLLGFQRVLDEVLAQQQCFSLKDLKVNGLDLRKIGYQPGPALGAELNRLLDLVIDGECENTQAALLAAIRLPEVS